VQQARPREQVQYAGLGWRFAAVIVDSMVLFALLVVAFAVLVAAGVLDLNDPLLNRGFSLDRTVPSWMYVLSYGLVFVYYTLLEALTGSSLGKLAFGMRVTMDDGSRPTGLAVVVRNVLRIPEVLVWYIPAGISCLVSAKNKRLGDLAARTVVVRRGAAAVAPLWPAARPAAPAVPSGPEGGAPLPPAPPNLPALPDALAALKTAALAVRGAHHSYLRFSELELAREAAAHEAGAAAAAADAEAAYSPEYVAAWHTLADAVMAMQKAHGAAGAAAARAGSTLTDACRQHPDLAVLFRELEPYFTAADEQVHDAYLRVARAETRA
jgi:uncharacterized RDD family membrane protein YckC